MDQASALRTTLAGFLGISADALTPDFSLGATKLTSSIQRAMLYAQLRSQAGLVVRGMPTFKTYGELESQLLNGYAASGSSAVGSAARTVPTTVQPTVRNADPAFSAANLNDPPISCGIDIESVASLPATSDYWEHDFYTSHFTREEIAFCLLQNNPAVHLAGRWCVKEALKKCDPKFLTVSMNEIEIRNGSTGAPAIWDLTNGNKRKLSHSASLSHTDDFAVGTVVRLSAGAMAAASTPPVAMAANLTPPSQPIVSARQKINLVGVAGVLIALVALALAAYSVWGRH